MKNKEISKRPRPIKKLELLIPAIIKNIKNNLLYLSKREIREIIVYIKVNFPALDQ